MEGFEKRIFRVQNEKEFGALAMEIFHLQAIENPVYAAFLRHLGVDHTVVQNISEIPFLPIELFKSHRVVTGNRKPVLHFESSGTTGQVPSRQYLVSEAIYRESFVRTFTANYGKPEDLCILALLPSYMERQHSSLIYMMDHLIGRSKYTESGFYLHDLSGLTAVLQKRVQDGHPTLLLGVSFALLDLAEQYPMKLSPNITLMETGGMKGRRREMIREELHAVLKAAFNQQHIHSEYGMTELLSQAYAKDGRHFHPPPWMRVITRDLYDPLTLLPPVRSGGINVIDLANRWSCSFIATGDVGRVHANGSFEVTGRFEQAEVRGCNLMVV
ncbi:MAG: acyltransferase [Bacteroidales bacterium]|nr:acyltransferase [Bacteroidales bacterium]MDT8430676.1 acyltransferase [Bacteroidales bacterium]